MNKANLTLGASLLLWMCASVSFCADKSGPASAGAKPETAADPSFDPENIPKLAVIVLGPQPGKRAQTNAERYVEDAFVAVLMRKGYSVTSRSDLEAVLKEQHFQKSGLTEADAAAIGKILNVPAVMVVKVTELDAENKRVPGKTSGKRTSAHRTAIEATAGMGARLISVEKASVLWIGTFRRSRVVGSKSDVPEVIADVAKQIISAFPAQKSTAKGEKGESEGDKSND